MKIYFVDAFTNEKFKGNPAAVCLAETEPGEATMQKIAFEIGFSETAFVTKLAEGRYRIRFFTPKQEIPLCGHATLASAKVIFDTTHADSLTFFNNENVELRIGRKEEGIVMEFPVYETEHIEVPAKMLGALGLDRIIEARFSPRNRIILLTIEHADALARLQPDFEALVNSYSGINGVLVTARSGDADYDFHYRYFWPWAGTNEDPVTGGVQTFLTKYWAGRIQKNKFRAFQSSYRTGAMTTELLGDKVLICGEAVIVLEGDFRL